MFNQKIANKSFAANLNDAVDSARLTSMYLEAFVLRYKLEMNTPLNMAAAWSLLGYEGKPTKKEKLNYTRANNMQRRFSQQQDLLKNLPANKAEWPEKFRALVELVMAIDFEKSYGETDFAGLELFGYKSNIYLASGSDFRDLMTKCLGVPKADSSPKADNKKPEQTSDDDQSETDELTADQVADQQRQKEAVKALLEQASKLPEIGDAVVEALRCDNVQQAVALMAQAWMKAAKPTAKPTAKAA